MKRLSAEANRGGPASWPAYTPEDHGVGIVHLGLGNFARAHLLSYTDTVLAQKGGDWRVTGVSLRGTAVADSLNPQDGRYTLITRGLVTEARVIGALDRVLSGPKVGQDVLNAMISPGCRIVSLTVTEKGYGISSDGRLDHAHPAIAADLANPETPSSVIGLVVAALSRREAAGLPAFTVLSCDNLSHNVRSCEMQHWPLLAKLTVSSCPAGSPTMSAFPRPWWIGSRQHRMQRPPGLL